MSYELASFKIIEILEGTALDKQGVLNFGKQLRHDPQGSSDATARVARSFFLWAVGGGDIGAYHRGIREAEIDLEWVTFYPNVADRRLLDIVMEADRTNACARLAEVSLWNRPASGIINIAVGSERFLPFARRAVTGGWEQAQALTLKYRGQVSTAGR